MKKNIIVIFIVIFAFTNFGCSQNSKLAISRGNLERTGLYNSDEKLLLGQFDWKFKGEYVWFSSPVISQGVVFVNGAGGNFYAVDANSGESKWVFKRDKWIGSSPTISNNVAYVGGLDNFLYAVDAKSGVEKWRYETGDMIVSSPAVVDGIVYFGSYDGNLYALDANTGKEKWKFKTQGLDTPFNTSASPEYEVLGAITSDPAISEHTIYFGSLDGHLYALDSKTGMEKWRFNTGDILSSTPAIANGIIYFGDYHGYLYALDDKGQLKWKFKTQDWGLVSNVAISDGIVYLASSFRGNGYNQNHNYSLFAVEAESGKALWKSKLTATTYQLTVADNILYFGDNDGVVFAFDAITGKELWSFKTESEISSEIVIAEGRIFFCTQDGYLYALR